MSPEMPPKINRPVLEFASWPSNTARLCGPTDRPYDSVFVHVHPVVRLSVCVMLLVALASEFSNVVGLKTVISFWNRLNENWLRRFRSGRTANFANALPRARSPVLRSNWCAHAYLSGLVLFPNPVAFPDAKLPPMS